MSACVLYKTHDQNFKFTEVLEPLPKLIKWFECPYEDWKYILSDFQEPLIICTFYQNKTVQKMWNWYQGHIHGIFKEWWPNGQMAIDCRYIGGKINGKYLRWYEDGSPWADYTYIYGKKIGLQKRWLGSGKLVEEKYYK